MTGISALPLAQEEGNGQGHQKFRGVSKITGPTWSHLPTLTIGLLGVQILWSVEMSYASPYLLSLGLSKPKMAIVFVAGPVSGLVMQPLIGALADNCTSKFGRRRPYMIAGTIICIFAMLLLGFTRWFASIFTGWDNDSNDLLTIWLAVFAIYFIDFSINAVMAVDRALLVDTLPSSQQPQGNAWAARMMATGAIVGFFVGNVDLTRRFPFLGKTQLQVLSVVASLVLLWCHLITAVLTKEKVLLPNTDTTGKAGRKSFVQELKDIWTDMLNLPRVIRQICFIQFFAWLGWFPLLFYTSIYIGDLYKRASPVPSTEEAQAALDTDATRLGSRALFWQSIISLIGNIVLPYFVTESAAGSGTGGNQKPHLRFGYGSNHTWWRKITRLVRVPMWMRIHLADLWALSHLVFALCMFATFLTSSVGGASLMIAVTGCSWAMAMWAPFSLLATAILTEASDDDNTAIRLSDTRTRPRRINSSDLDVDADADERNVFLPGEASESEGENENDPDEAARKEERKRVLRNSTAQVSRVDISSVSNGDGYHMVNGEAGNGEVRDAQSGGGLSAKAGIILGIHNIFIVIPQFLVTGLSSLIFAIFDPQNPGIPSRHGAPVHAPIYNGTDVNVLIANSTDTVARLSRDVVLKWIETRQEFAGEDENVELQYEGSNSVVYIFRFGGIAATIAAVLSWRLARELRHR
ncbi:General alpha-glucoside permease [Leucoagaricus sp. SymC.cos]|nr:General alpha-glucoside permease [Leucoagaricus sp. SymC.cos]